MSVSPTSTGGSRPDRSNRDAIARMGFHRRFLERRRSIRIGGPRQRRKDDGTGDGEDLVEELIDAKLVFELKSIGSGVRIRSRFAEMMRLVAANRQLFPNKPWRGAPHLAADFRVDRRPPPFSAARAPASGHFGRAWFRHCVRLRCGATCGKR